MKFKDGQHEAIVKFVRLGLAKGAFNCKVLWLYIDALTALGFLDEMSAINAHDEICLTCENERNGQV